MSSYFLFPLPAVRVGQRGRGFAASFAEPRSKFALRKLYELSADWADRVSLMRWGSSSGWPTSA